MVFNSGQPRTPKTEIMADPEKHEIVNEFIATTNTIKNESIFRNAENPDEILNQTESIVPVVTCADESRYSIIESVNDHCLLHICSYLCFMDIVNLSATCIRLQNFANDYVFPRTAKQMSIVANGPHTVLLTAPLFNGLTSQITMNGLDALLSYIGKFIEKLNIKFYFCITLCHQMSPHMIYELFDGLKYCKNLMALRIKSFNLNREETHVLYDRIGMLQDLKEFQVERCDGIIENWPTTSQHISKVKRLILFNVAEFKIHFFRHFAHLYCLIIDVQSVNFGLDRLLVVLEHSSSCLKYLKLVKFGRDNLLLPENVDYASIAKFINEKLPKLKRFDFQGFVTEKSITMINIPLLTSLQIDVLGGNLNYIMRTLSNNGTIKELIIFRSTYVDEDVNAPPLVFKKLQTIKLCHVKNSSKLLNSLTTSHMPEIHTFCFGAFEVEPFLADDILTFYESKHTLDEIIFADQITVTPSFLRRLIMILKKSTPKRPFLTLGLNHTVLTPEHVSTIMCASSACHQHNKSFQYFRLNC